MYRVICTHKNKRTLLKQSDERKVKQFSTFHEAKLAAEKQSSGSSSAHVWTVEQTWSISE
ncbi:hypothetical protein [Shouchella patagoniensis]|uniref:hypothetical protein n=1 Tax=Shouchella patagoniensis TaxID=228576 RepID=UPI000995AF58|nr:hypothetical protein [Shouchella patagoniensis]